LNANVQMNTPYTRSILKYWSCVCGKGSH